jgi:hypothetical protein
LLKQRMARSLKRLGRRTLLFKPMLPSQRWNVIQILLVFLT